MKTKKIPYNKSLLGLAKESKENMSDAEKLMQSRLRKGKMLGFNFSSQIVIGELIVDFYCKQLRLVIEVLVGPKEVGKPAIFKKLGVTLIEIKSQDIEKDIDKVVTSLEEKVKKLAEKNKPKTTTAPVVKKEVKKPVEKKTTVKKQTAKKSPAKKTIAKVKVIKKSVEKKATVKKPTAKKKIIKVPVEKKAAVKKTVAKPKVIKKK